MECETLFLGFWFFNVDGDSVASFDYVGHFWYPDYYINIHRTKPYRRILLSFVRPLPIEFCRNPETYTVYYILYYIPGIYDRSLVRAPSNLKSAVAGGGDTVWHPLPQCLHIPQQLYPESPNACILNYYQYRLI